MNEGRLKIFPLLYKSNKNNEPLIFITKHYHDKHINYKIFINFNYLFCKYMKLTFYEGRRWS